MASKAGPLRPISSRGALGIRMHTGWGAVVAVRGSAEAWQVVLRKRIVTASAPEKRFAYHCAAEMPFEQGEQFVADAAAESLSMARAEIEEMLRECEAQGIDIAGAVVLCSSDKELPDLARILASHSLIHGAEGELFREAVRQACAGLKLSIDTVLEKTLPARAEAAWGSGAESVREQVAALGREIGPPWTADHRAAALAAALWLAGDQ